MDSGSSINKLIVQLFILFHFFQFDSNKCSICRERKRARGGELWFVSSIARNWLWPFVRNTGICIWSQSIKFQLTSKYKNEWVILLVTSLTLITLRSLMWFSKILSWKLYNITIDAWFSFVLSIILGKVNIIFQNLTLRF